VVAGSNICKTRAYRITEIIVWVHSAEPLSLLKTRFYHIIMKSHKSSGIFCQIEQFYGGMGGQTSPRPGNSGTFTKVNPFSAKPHGTGHAGLDKVSATTFLVPAVWRTSLMNYQLCYVGKVSNLPAYPHL
jgi:hypothetical protein